MQRNQFIKTVITGAIGMTTLPAFRSFTNGLMEQEQVMPVLFIGHGSPMNGIEDTEFSRRWTQMAKEIPTPKAVLVVSAHWFTKGTQITAMDFPRTIHDFGGFPRTFRRAISRTGKPGISKRNSSVASFGSC